MAHIAPVRWADASRGRLSKSQLTAMESHIARCPRCAAERARVLTAMAAFTDIRDAEPPDLRWEHIGARVYWTTSSEQRAGHHANRLRNMAWVAIPTGLIVAAGVLLLLRGDSDSRSDERHASTDVPADSRAIGDPRAETVARSQTTPDDEPGSAMQSATPRDLIPGSPDPLDGVVTFLQGAVTLDGEPLGFDDALRPGQRIVTTTGETGVQFGKQQSFTIRPDSSVELRAFDDREVILAVDGEIVLDVAHRQPHQRFVIIAGTRTVHVRGTSFSVSHRDGNLRVACAQGAVAVAEPDADAKISVRAGRVLEYRDDKPRWRELTPAEADDLRDRIYRVPTWTAQLRQHTSSLHIAASANEAVGLDGEFVGVGTLTIRVMPGRHHVGIPGERGAWIEVDAGKQHDSQVRKADSQQRLRARARAQRRAELDRAITSSGRLAGCVNALRKQDLLSGAFIALELGVLADGTISYLNIADTDLPQATAQCVRDTVDRVAFGRGQAISWTHRLEW